MKITAKSLFIIISLLLCLNLPGYAQNKNNTFRVTDTLHINFDNQYQLSAVSIVPFSEVIMLRGRVLDRKDYRISYERAYFKLSDTVAYSIFDTLYVTYSTIGPVLNKVYKRRSLVVKIDEKSKDTLNVLKNSEGSGLSTEAIFGRDLQKSGTIARGFTFGTTRDFTLTSGLRLQLAGKISENVEIVAALTDENTPIQPEGNTERLEELDKVFIEIRHPNAVGTFGDYDLVNRQGEFTGINRKLQGLKADLNYKNYSSTVAVAGSRGKFNSLQFTGVEGVQGPYRLYGQNNERDIILIAGSERVYLNGEEMRRGERNDYTIEYSNAEITFTPNRLITSASRISVDFEYTDRRYSRTFMGAGFQTEQLEGKLKVGINMFREGDNQDAPIDITLSENDKQILESAGDNRVLASRSGAQLVESDTVKGVYSRIDTLISGTLYSIYVYTPGNAQYNVTFSYVGEGNGDYLREGLGHYRFAGISQGAYMPVIYLPLPELKQIGSIVLEAAPFKDVILKADLAGSIWDKNRFSGINDEDNFGSARNFFIDVKPRNIKIAGNSLGRAGISYKDRYIQDRFTSLDRINNVEFGRSYNTDENSVGSNEQLRELTFNYLPVNNMTLSSMYGYLKKGEDFRSDRFLNRVSYRSSEKYSADYQLDYVNSSNSLQRTFWLRQDASAFYNWKFLRPGISYLAEDRKDKSAGRDSLLLSSLKYSEIIPSLDISALSGLRFKIKYSYRRDQLPIDGSLTTESKSFTQLYELEYKGIKEVNSSMNVTIRNKQYSDIFRSRGLLDNEIILVRSQNRFNFWQQAVAGELYYETSTQRSARYERVFVRVPQGTGSYRYLGDINNNGIAEENEFEPVLYDGDFIVTTIPTDRLFPVVDLKTNTRWKVSFEKFFKSKSLPSEILQPVSTETSFRVEENSRETNTSKIYFLNFSSFLNDSTTIRGFNLFQQDLFLWENSSELSIRLRYLQRRSLNQFAAGLERGYNREQGIRIKFKLVEEIANQTDLAATIDNVDAPLSSNRARKITSTNLSTDFSYRPVRNIEAGFKIGAGRSEDRYPVKPTVIDQNSQTFRLNLSFANSGRLRFEFERNELSSNTSENYIPFELTRGNYIGKNYFWRLNFDYRLSGNLQSTVSYDGRLQGNNRAIHTARAEMRAYF